MKRRVFSWTDKQVDKLNKVKNILLELDEFKPLTLRQVYYQLVGKGYIENNVSQYGMLSKLLKHARIDGYISWDDIEDRVRAYHDLTGWGSSTEYISSSVEHFLTTYKRDLLQTQDVYIELWIEKDALSSIFTRVASRFTVPVVVCRGFSSVSFLNDYKTRLSYYKDKTPLLLYFGDFDPSGVEMLTAMETTLKEELNVTGIIFKRIALSKEDVFLYNLPHSPDALKKTDTRAKKHIEEFGEIAVELDALPPQVLQDKIEEAIIDNIQLRLFIEEEQTQVNEFDLLNKIKTDVKNLMNDYF